MVEGQIVPEKCPRFTLNNGTKIPVIGLGTFLMTDNPKEMVKRAILEYGYRHIDTAMIYGNEELIGEALEEVMAAGVPREELYITTKLWHSDYQNVEEACRTSLRKLKLEYIDLYLVHWVRPCINWESENWEITNPPHHVIWSKMEALVDAGLTKSIGVSNCVMPMLADMLAYARIKPVVNQVEVHPYFQQKQCNKFHRKWGIYLQAYASIGSGHWQTRPGEFMDLNPLTDAVITEIAAAKGKSPAQVILAWHLQRETIPLVKTTKAERLGENMASCDVSLTPEEVAKIDSMDKGARLYNPKFLDERYDWNYFPFFD
uniref:NADP-dependent oxidoreductase domain-containing protein n=2 Tax=Choreotrichia TaxID=141411 RepID=A0A7S3HWF1_9SPIT